MNMTGIEKQGAPDHKFQFNQGTGEKQFKTEREEDFNLNWDLTKHRGYDYQLGRLTQVDPLADEAGQESWTSYHYGFNNPILYNDPMGMMPCPTGDCPDKKDSFAAKADKATDKAVDYVANKGADALSFVGDKLSEVGRGFVQMASHVKKDAKSAATYTDSKIVRKEIVLEGGQGESPIEVAEPITRNVENVEMADVLSLGAQSPTHASLEEDRMITLPDGSSTKTSSDSTIQKAPTPQKSKPISGSLDLVIEWEKVFNKENNK